MDPATRRESESAREPARKPERRGRGWEEGGRGTWRSFSAWRVIRAISSNGRTDAYARSVMACSLCGRCASKMCRTAHRPNGIAPACTSGYSACFRYCTGKNRALHTQRNRASQMVASGIVQRGCGHARRRALRRKPV
eukprot:3864342-Rhodomonas_salina.3